MDAIIKGILGNLFGILLMFIPVIFIYVIGRNFYNFREKMDWTFRCCGWRICSDPPSGPADTAPALER